MRAATRHYAQANGYELEEPEVRPQDTAAEAGKQAVEAFLAEHEGLERSKHGDVQVGRLVASVGQFAVLHVGRGRHVLHDFKTEQALNDFVRSQSPDRGLSLGR